MINISYLLKLIKQNESALKIAGLYLIIGCLWILFSDKLAASFSRDTTTLTRISLYKGWGYVFITALLLFWLIHRDWINLQDSEQRFRVLFENNPLPMWLTDRVSLQFLEVNDAAIQHYSYSREEFMSMTEFDLILPENLSVLTASAEKEKFAQDFRHRCKDGRLINVQIAMHPFKLEGRQVGLTAITDITERKRSEIALKQSEERYRVLIEQAGDGIFVTDATGRYVEVNPAGLAMLGYEREELLQKNLGDLIPTEDKAKDPPRLDELRAGKTLLTERHLICKDGSLLPVEINATMLPDGRLQGIVRDISERKRVDEALTETHNRLAATVAAIPDLMFEVDDRGQILDYHAPIRDELYDPSGAFLGKTVEEVLPADAAGIINNALAQAAIEGGHRGASYALDLPIGRRWFELSIARKPGGSTHAPRFLTLARDITERKLAEEALQEANQNLRLAYDATIEGWSNALDLRDKETEGHTRRVLNLTVELARAMGISEADLIHIRRGALLHDIGKMGVPDQILLKPDELTDEEWQTMRQHPVHAFNLLSRIDFLHPALDIPHYHHERWDGTGYPEGLMGAQIPLTARIFAIVDVWDALTSDRPYRKAWSEEKALEYIREQSGQYFDPQIVEKFLKLIGKKNDALSGGT